LLNKVKPRLKAKYHVNQYAVLSVRGTFPVACVGVVVDVST
jgi:hypothetical protein